MHHIFKSVIAPYSDKQMYQLVNRIDDYPQFLNWCADARILKQSETQIIAFIKISKMQFEQSFTTINTLTPTTRIDMRLEDGIFSHLHGIWSFVALSDNACKVELDLKFSFNSKLLDLTLAPIFSKIANAQLDAFVARAEQIYA